ALFFTAIFFAWVNLCKKDFTRRPLSKGVPLFAERPRSRDESLLCGLLLGRGYRSEGTAHHCRSLQLPEGRAAGLVPAIARALRQGVYRRGSHGPRGPFLPIRRA